MANSFLFSSPVSLQHVPDVSMRMSQGSVSTPPTDLLTPVPPRE